MNVAEKLAREIRRVATLRERYHALIGRAQVNGAPAVVLMDAALEYACKAVGGEDVIMQSTAGQMLEQLEE